jgi:hypothetical protein
MSALLAVEFVECSVDVIGRVAFLVSQDQAHKLWRHVVVHWHHYVDILYYVFLLLSEHFVWREKLIIRKRVYWVEWSQFV